MTKRQKEIYKFILVAVSFFLLVQPALNEQHAMSETAIFYPAPAFEHAHWASLVFEGRQGSYQWPLIVSSLVSLPITALLAPAARQNISDAVSRELSSILRC